MIGLENERCLRGAIERFSGASAIAANSTDNALVVDGCKMYPKIAALEEMAAAWVRKENDPEFLAQITERYKTTRAGNLLQCGGD